MQVRHGFTGVRPVVDDEPVAAFFQAEFVGDFRGFQQQVPEELVVFRRSLGDAWNGLLGDDQDVRGRVGFDVTKRQHQVVFINDGCRNFPRHDFIKECFAHKQAGGSGFTQR